MRIRPWIAGLVSYTSSGRCCHLSDDRLWTAELSASTPRGAAISRAIRPPAAGSLLPVAELPASERRCHPLDVRLWTAGLSTRHRWNAAVSRQHLVLPFAALLPLSFYFSFLSFL